MRGKGSKRVSSHLPSRITPAYAGKREAWKIGGYRSKDHPRLCGEKETTRIPQCSLLGSPPPMRGKASPLTIRRQILRITPAYAGKSCFPYEIRSTS